MHITRRPLYRRAFRNLPLHIRGVLLALALIVPVQGLTSPEFPDTPFEQEFLVTAYYSPEPHQCCYVTGGYAMDMRLNGEGKVSADGTKVFPGMIAAPARYPFGTAVTLPGIGTFTVHDRGGAIVENGDGVHRLDIWVGHGEAGLARAVAFGVQRIRGTIFPIGAEQPSTSFALENLPAPLEGLETYFVERGNLLAMRPKEGDLGLSVRVLQEYLRELQYFDRAPTSFFGPETKRSLAQFLRDFHVNAPEDRLSEHAAAHLLAATARLSASDPLATFIDDHAPSSQIMDAQKLLRFFGVYRGRTDGKYSDALKAAILRFQQMHGLVGTPDDPGAGRIGPVTMRIVRDEWNRRLVSGRAEDFLDIARAGSESEKLGRTLAHFLEEGMSGPQVTLLQQLLSERGFFPADAVNGNFGLLTKSSLIQYQIARNIVRSENDSGAGIVGPATLRTLRSEQRLASYARVRADGWRAL